MFYPGDWLKDPAVRLLTSASRGIWIDLLCAMHESDRSGQISGTRDQLARLARCTPVEFDQAIAEFQLHRTADLTERNGIVTLVNRRMKREAKERHQNNLRVARHRNKEPCNAADTPLKRESNDPLSVAASLSGSQPTNPPRGRGGDPTGNQARTSLSHPDLKTVLVWAAIVGCPPDEAERFWHHFESSGWIDKNGHRILNARSKLILWKTDHAARQAELEFRSARPGQIVTHIDPARAAAARAAKLIDQEKKL